MSTGEENSFLKIIDDKFKISKRGRSLQVTIPVEVAEKINIKEGDFVKFFVDEENKYAVIMDKKKVAGSFAEIKGLGKAMYFTRERLIIDELGKERAEELIRDSIRNCYKEYAGKGYTLYLSREDKELVEFYNIDMNAIRREFKGMKIGFK